MDTGARQASETEASEPALRPIKSGWAASGKGWAVHGATREDATARFYEAVRQHRMIEARPYWYEQLQALSHHNGRQPQTSDM